MNRDRALILAAAGAAIAGASFWVWSSFGTAPRADPNDPAQVALGERIYAAHCGACHGAALEGQPNWRQRLPNGRLPAPPHDASGHSWHHPDQVLFEITKDGIAAHATAGYESDMPAFAGKLSDSEIWAVLAFIKQSWPPDVRERQSAVTARYR